MITNIISNLNLRFNTKIYHPIYKITNNIYKFYINKYSLDRKIKKKKRNNFGRFFFNILIFFIFIFAAFPFGTWKVGYVEKV